MTPDPQNVVNILDQDFALDRLDIYRRMKLISELHKGTTQQNEARSFAIGKEYEINADTLFKTDLQNSEIVVPKYFYTERAIENDVVSEYRADFPMLFMTAGERQITDKAFTKSSYLFDLVVFDLMFYDRNNFSGNETSMREKEDIWNDTEKILMEIIEALRTSDASALFNQVWSSEYLGYSRDPNDWTPAEALRVEQLIKKTLCSKNFDMTISSSIFPFCYEKNKRLAGVSVSFDVNLYTGCNFGIFTDNRCQ